MYSDRAMSSKVQALILLVSQTPKSTLVSSQPNVQSMLGGMSSGVKWLGREADHSRPSNAEAKNGWSCTYAAPTHLHGCASLALTFCL